MPQCSSCRSLLWEDGEGEFFREKEGEGEKSRSKWEGRGRDRQRKERETTLEPQPPNARQASHLKRLAVRLIALGSGAIQAEAGGIFRRIDSDGDGKVKNKPGFSYLLFLVCFFAVVVVNLPLAWP